MMLGGFDNLSARLGLFLPRDKRQHPPKSHAVKRYSNWRPVLGKTHNKVRGLDFKPAPCCPGFADALEPFPGAGLRRGSAQEGQD